ncbi:MAG: radical SAM protein [Thermoplasmata archaeon]|nr:radical SAM protein [Thermoplasmata archaeon]
MTDLLEKKAILSLGGGIRLPEGYVVPCRISHSTAGPGAGFGSVAFAFGGFRVKKSVSYDSGEFELHVAEDGKLSLTRGGEPFLAEVTIQPVVRHCPEQAFFNLDPRCMYHCAYCSSPLLDMSEDKHLSTGKIMQMLDESIALQNVKAVSFTSGVVGSIDETIGRLVDAISAVRAKYPDMPIGVEPYVGSAEHIRMLKAAGADEIKLNLETPSREIFARVCPDLDYDGIIGFLKEAVQVFGKGRVVSNIIYGLGETDGDLREAMETLCSIGVIPGLRALRVNRINRESLTAAIGEPVPVTPERALAVARMQKEIMQAHGLTSKTSGTMCMECGCCDLVPFRDL